MKALILTPPGVRPGCSIQKTFENMTIAELSVISDRAVEELIDHAAAGFDRHTQRAGR